jgi:hypothetical protein
MPHFGPLMKLRIVPTDLKTANEFVRRLHRHSRPVVGCVVRVCTIAQPGGLSMPGVGWLEGTVMRKEEEY